MFEVGFTELLLIFALALLVLGPQKLPKLAQQVGRWVGRARAMARQFRDQLEEEAHNLETQVSIDPDIDTSLDPKRPATSPTATTAPAAAPAPAPQPPPYQDVEENFYPPDHHMHPDRRAEADANHAQGELDLTSSASSPAPEAPLDPPPADRPS
jgi:sec-independent protein translocase protein TatB